MDEKWYWMELIGFDNTLADFGVSDFLDRVARNEIHGVSLLLYSIDFVNLHAGMEEERLLSPAVCSYAGHPFNEERGIQKWTNHQLRALIEELHRHSLQVLLSVFDLSSYRDENGTIAGSDFLKDHPELCDFWSAAFIARPVVHILKRFQNGGFYEDYFLSKLADTVSDYGFDGLHLADGLSSPRSSLQSGDFSDDIVAQFLQSTGLTMPAEIAGPCDQNRDAHQRRYRHIMQDHRYAFTRFIAERFTTFYNKLYQTLSQIHAFYIFNQAWARDPLEALFRYGVDVGQLSACGAYGMMLEDVGGSMPVMSEDDLGWRRPVADRLYSQYDMFFTQLAIKTHAPALRLFHMTPLKDTQEDWNLIDTAPYELHKMIVRRKNTVIRGQTGFAPVSDGAFYCLSDGLSKAQWERVGQMERFADLPGIIGAKGFTAIGNRENLYPELRRMIEERKASSGQLLQHLAAAGIAVVTMADVSDLPGISGPILVPNAELYTDEALSYLETYRDGVMVLTGYTCPLKRRPDAAVLEGDEGIGAFVFNCKQLEGANINLGVKKPAISRDFEDDVGGIWTAPLRYDQPSSLFLKEVGRMLATIRLYPLVMNDVDCRVMAYDSANGKQLIVVSNDSFAAEVIKIRLPDRIKNVRSLNKPAWYPVAYQEDTVTIRVNNRAVEILEAVCEDG